MFILVHFEYMGRHGLSHLIARPRPILVPISDVRQPNPTGVIMLKFHIDPSFANLGDRSFNVLSFVDFFKDSWIRKEKD